MARADLVAHGQHLVAQRGGDQAEDAGDCPGKAEPLIDGEDGIAVAAYPRPLDEEKRRRILGIDAVTAADRVSSDALDRGEPEMRRPVVAQYGSSEEHTYELQSLMRISYAVFC